MRSDNWHLPLTVFIILCSMLLLATARPADQNAHLCTIGTGSFRRANVSQLKDAYDLHCFQLETLHALVSAGQFCTYCNQTTLTSNHTTATIATYVSSLFFQCPLPPTNLAPSPLATPSLPCLSRRNMATALRRTLGNGSKALFSTSMTLNLRRQLSHLSRRTDKSRANVNSVRTLVIDLGYGHAVAGVLLKGMGLKREHAAVISDQFSSTM
uniref:Uncharacterized protein n=1 Tax=Palpitomonas bilix TaxID=652834 RepID=A0A7S3GGW7_9EUKA